MLAEFFIPLGLPELCVGGGLGVSYVAAERAPSIAQWADAVHSECRRSGIPAETRVTAEPGRSIVADAAVTLYRVGTIKDIPGVRTYMAVDGGMSDNPRPVLYGSGYETFLPRAVDAVRPCAVRVVGKHCESGDVVVSDGRLPVDTVVGDVVATPVTGAYGYSMASNYNKVPRPEVVFVADGRARVVVRRETDEDLVRLDLSAPFRAASCPGYGAAGGSVRGWRGPTAGGRSGPAVTLAPRCAWPCSAAATWAGRSCPCWWRTPTPSPHAQGCAWSSPVSPWATPAGRAPGSPPS